MQPINFITTIAPKAQRSLRFWYRCTVVLLGLLCGTIGVLQGLQLITFFSMRSQEKRLQQQHMLDAPALNNLNELQQRTKKLEDDMASVTQLVAKQQQLTLQLKAIKKALPGASLESYTYSLQNLAITFTCGSPQEATSTLQLLKQHLPEIQGLTLVSLQPHRKSTRASYTAHIKGKVS